MWKFPKNWRIAFASIPCPSFFFFLVAALFFAGCAEKSLLQAPKTALENPLRNFKGASLKDFQDSYELYLSGDQKQARLGFHKILKTRPDFFPANLAIAYTYLAESDTDVAERYALKALEQAPEYPQAHFVLAQIDESRMNYEGALLELSATKAADPDYPSIEQDRNILRLKATEMHLTEARKLIDSDPDKALKLFQAARALAPEVPQIPWEMAQVFVKRNDCTGAMPYLQEAMDESPDDATVKTQFADCLADTEQYEDALAMYEEIAKSSAGVDVSRKIENVQKVLSFRSMPEEYRSISKEDQVNRAQLAALLVINLKFLHQYRPQSSEIMVDIFDHWAKSYIQKTVDLGIMDVFPNRTFEPRRSITRLELAKAAARLIQILETQASISIPSPSEPVVVPDVSAGNLYYSMISTALSAGVLSLDSDGFFHPGRPVTGAEAMSVVNRLQTLAE